jgi:hypothetical protein
MATLSDPSRVPALIDPADGLPYMALGASGGQGAPANPAIPAGEAHIGEVGSAFLNPSANFTRTNANATPYSIADLVANSETAASVVAMQFTVARVAAGSFAIRRASLKKSGSANTGDFRLHLYLADPALSSGIAGGDNAAWSTKESGYLGSFDISTDRAFTDAQKGFGLPTLGNEIARLLPSGTVIYGLLEARSAFTPIASEVFTVELDVWPN